LFEPIQHVAHFFWNSDSEFPQDLKEGSRGHFGGTIRVFTSAYIRLDDAEWLKDQHD
jgi:hypothetical protein